MISPHGGCLLNLGLLLQDQTLTGKRIVLYSSDEPDKKANAALLLALYAVSRVSFPYMRLKARKPRLAPQERSGLTVCLLMTCHCYADDCHALESR